MKKLNLWFVVFITVTLLFAAGCGNGKSSEPPHPKAVVTTSVLGQATGTAIVEPINENVTLVIKTSREAMNAFYSIEEFNFEGRNQAMKVWRAVFKKELAATKTSPDLERLGNFVPSRQDDLQEEWIEKRESVWRQEVDQAQNCRQFFSAYQLRPYWLSNEQPRYQDWCNTGLNEINAAKSTNELIDLQNFLPRENNVMLALEYASWKIRLKEEMEKAETSEAIQEIINQLIPLLGNQKG